MEDMLTIVQTLATADDQRDQLGQLYAMLDEHQVFRTASQHIESTVAHISNLLNDPAQRPAGLLLLHQFLAQCPLDVLEQKGVHWTTFATKICSGQRTDAELVALAGRILEQLLRRSVHVPELAKALNSTLLPKIVEAIVALPPASHPVGLRLLAELQRLYPSATSVGRANVERFIYAFADSPDERLVRAAGRCLLLLQQTRGGGGADGQAHKTAWATLQVGLIAQLHQLLDGIYASTTEIHDTQRPADERLPLPELSLSDEPIARSTALVQRFRNLCEFLSAALVEPFPVPKAIKPLKYIGLISRGLAVNCRTLANNPIVDNIVVGALLPHVHCALFALLDALIAVLRSNALPYGRTIGQLLVQSLQWTSSGRAQGRKRPFAGIRQACYGTMRVWTRTVGAACGLEQFADDVVPQLVQDMTPFHTEVRLKVLSGARKHMSKKARKTAHRAQNEASHMAQAHGRDGQTGRALLSDAGNEPLAMAALQTLGELVLAIGQFLKPVVHKLMQEHLVKLAALVALRPPTDATALATGVRELYASAESRVALYGTLQALVMGPHHLCPPPLQYAREIFAWAAGRDPVLAVRDACAGHVRVLERLVHPQRDTLHFPVDAAAQRDALAELRKIGRHGEQSDDDEDELGFGALKVNGDAEAEGDDEEPLSGPPEAADDDAEANGDVDGEENAEVEDDGDGDEEQAEDADENGAESGEEAEADEAMEDEAEDDEDEEQQPEDDEENLAPSGYPEKRTSSNDKEVEVEHSAKRPKFVSAEKMAEDEAAEAMVDELMESFCPE